VSSRDRIQLSATEQRELLESERVVVVSSVGPRGWPHSMPMWFVLRDGEVWMWTYGKSQKVRNLQRDPRATLLVETGEAYDQLRGVMIEADAEIVADPEVVLGVGLEIATRYGGGAAPPPEAEAVLAAQARKRVAVRFRPVETATWDHRKL
jgi:PPOX class probable F420-dependent enzyme